MHHALKAALATAWARGAGNNTERNSSNQVTSSDLTGEPATIPPHLAAHSTTKATTYGSTSVASIDKATPTVSTKLTEIADAQGVYTPLPHIQRAVSQGTERPALVHHAPTAALATSTHHGTQSRNLVSPMGMNGYGYGYYYCKKLCM